jgi:hypothetical protein
MDTQAAVAFVMIFTAMFGSVAFEQWSKAECRIEAIKAGKTAEDIVKICK